MKPLCLLLLTIPFIQPVHAGNALSRTGTGDTLALAQACWVALTENPGIQQSRKRWAAARERVTQEAAWEDPKVSANSRFARFVSISPNSFADQSISLEQMIPISGKNRSRTRAAIADALSAFEDVRRRELDVLANVRSSYLRLTNIYAQTELTRKDLVSLKEIASAARFKYEAGKQGAADVLNAEIESGKLEETQHDLMKSIATEQSALNVLMNRDAFEAMAKPAEATLQPLRFSVKQLRSLMLANRPEIKMAEAKLASEAARLELARRDWIPDPAVSLEAQRYNGASQAVSELDAGISFSVPWVNYPKHSAEVREAADNVSAAQRALEGERNSAAGMLRDQLQTIETARHHLALFHDKLLPQARQALEASQSAYEGGKGGFWDWITAQRNVRDMESMERQHSADYEAGMTGLEALVGTDLKLLPPIRLPEGGLLK